MNIIDREAVYLALGTDHAGESLEQPGTSAIAGTEKVSRINPGGEYTVYYAKPRNSSDAFLDSLAAAKREEAVKPH